MIRYKLLAATAAAALMPMAASAQTMDHGMHMRAAPRPHPCAGSGTCLRPFQGRMTATSPTRPHPTRRPGYAGDETMFQRPALAAIDPANTAIPRRPPYIRDHRRASR